MDAFGSDILGSVDWDRICAGWPRDDLVRNGHSGSGTSWSDASSLQRFCTSASDLYFAPQPCLVGTNAYNITAVGAAWIVAECLANQERQLNR